MEIYTASDAKREFGELLMKSQQHPISVTRNGKPAAVLLSVSEYQTLKHQALKAALIEGERSGDAGELDMNAIKKMAREQVGMQD